MLGTGIETDSIRLLVLPVLGYAGYRDLETRRVPNHVWVGLTVAAVVLLVVDAYQYLDWIAALQMLALKTTLSIAFVGGFGYLFWRIGAFGGADAKAFITLSLLFPTFPTYHVSGLLLPIHETPVGVFSLTIITNTVLLGLGIPLVILARNLRHGRVTTASLLAYPVAIPNLHDTHGAILTTDTTGTPILSSRVDLDVVDAFFEWRDETITTFVAQHSPTDKHTDTESDDGDPYNVASFLDDTDAPTYGTSEDELIATLDTLASHDTDDTVWVSPGLPFITVLFFGAVVGFTYGDVLYSVLHAFVL